MMITSHVIELLIKPIRSIQPQKVFGQYGNARFRYNHKTHDTYMTSKGGSNKEIENKFHVYSDNK